MRTETVNISFQGDLLKAIDRVAREEFRNRSELIRDAARRYIESRKRWGVLFAFAKRQARRAGLKESDVSQAIAVFRRRKRRRPRSL